MKLHEIIKLENVSTTYEGEKRPAIKNINLSIKKNEFVYIVGPNAAGKTTLLETINGLLTPIQGKVQVFGQDIRKDGAKIRSEIGYVPQDFMVDQNEPYTALDVVLMGMYGKIGILKRVEDKHKTKALEVMELLGIKELANRPVGKLSGGQQQKVMIARALAKEPKILLLDEPFSNLDVESKEKIPKLIYQLHEERELTTLVVTHDANQIIQNVNRIVIMNEGKIIAEKTGKKLISSLKEFWWLPHMEAVE